MSSEMERVCCIHHRPLLWNLIKDTEMAWCPYGHRVKAWAIVTRDGIMGYGHPHVPGVVFNKAKPRTVWVPVCALQRGDRFEAPFEGCGTVRLITKSNSSRKRPRAGEQDTPYGVIVRWDHIRRRARLDPWLLVRQVFTPAPLGPSKHAAPVGPRYRQIDVAVE